MYISLPALTTTSVHSPPRPDSVSQATMYNPDECMITTELNKLRAATCEARYAAGMCKLAHEDVKRFANELKFACQTDKKFLQEHIRKLRKIYETAETKKQEKRQLERQARKAFAACKAFVANTKALRAMYERVDMELDTFHNMCDTIERNFRGKANKKIRDRIAASVADAEYKFRQRCADHKKTKSGLAPPVPPRVIYREFGVLVSYKTGSSSCVVEYTVTNPLKMHTTITCVPIETLTK